jgi:Xaa-Pro aminopeptidase
VDPDFNTVTQDRRPEAGALRLPGASFTSRRRLQHRILRFSFFIILLALLSVSAGARFRQPSEEYHARRTQLRESVDGPVIIFGYTGHEDASEVAVFFQEPYFYYLTGHDEPGAVLVLLPRSRTEINARNSPGETLYLPKRDLAEEKWEGPKIGPDDPGVADKTGFSSVKSVASLSEDLSNLVKSYGKFYTILPPAHEEGYPHFTESVALLRKAVPSARVLDVSSTLDAMRQLKSQGELALIQKAIDLSIDAHLDAMKRMRPGLFEYQVAARMREIHEMGGCEREAYAPIVGAGLNSTVLHYGALNDEIKDGDVVVIDVGGEYGGYAADITRTLPANGKFTPRQREIYEIVLGAQNAALAAVKPGVLLYGGAGSLQQIVSDYIDSHGRDQHGKTLGQYYIHGISHHLGLDVHDPGDRMRPLQAGMVITVEPGIYMPEEKLGVRIEDDVLVTKDGYQLLTARLPRTPEQIEATMAESHSLLEK